MISIIIPIYNVKPYLKQCLDSLVRQYDFPLIEIILINDGSTDGCMEICKEYLKINPSITIINKENGGLSDARNAGTAIAKGKYIYYLDSDDWIVPGAIETLYKYAIENSCDIVQGGFYYAYNNYLLLDERYIKAKTPPFILYRHNAMKELIKNNYVKNFAWGKLYNAEIVKSHPFPTGKFYEDSYWQHYIINEVNRYGIIPKPLYFYRQRRTSISGTFSNKIIDLLKGSEERLGFIKQNYPDLVELMTKEFWSLCYNICISTQKQKQHNELQKYWENINHKYSDLFSEYLKFNIGYILNKYFPKTLPLYNSTNQVINHYKSRKLNRISYNEAIS